MRPETAVFDAQCPGNAMIPPDRKKTRYDRLKRARRGSAENILEKLNAARGKMDQAGQAGDVVQNEQIEAGKFVQKAEKIVID